MEQINLTGHRIAASSTGRVNFGSTGMDFVLWEYENILWCVCYLLGQYLSHYLSLARSRRSLELTRSQRPFGLYIDYWILWKIKGEYLGIRRYWNCGLDKGHFHFFSLKPFWSDVFLNVTFMLLSILLALFQPVLILSSWDLRLFFVYEGLAWLVLNPLSTYTNAFHHYMDLQTQVSSISGQPH